MKTEENKAVRLLALNGVQVTATYDSKDRLIHISLETGTEAFDIPGPLFAQAAAMVPSGHRFGGGFVCPDHGPQDRPDYKWECPICHPIEPKALPEPEKRQPEEPDVLF